MPMDDYTALKFIQMREQELRLGADLPTAPDREPLRRRTARRLHRVARAIDVTDL